ncbi:MAG TPA: rod shape-determining protein MreC [Longimicrobiaceae bacterium]|nr:rod shape-determining protein MreC [Longimicrobiaceae bacterium]
MLALQSGVLERDTRFDDPTRLRAERDSLAAFLVGQSALATENEQLRSLLGLRQRLPPSFVPAEIIRIPDRAAVGFFELSVGSADGVRPGSPIVAPQGLVGRVRNADARIAFGIDWMNPEFAASAMTLDGQVYGIVEPRQGPGGEPMLALTGTPRHVRLRNGTLIVTSGHGGVFPRGVPIGRIAGVEGTETSWQRNYLIEPSVSPSEMDYVMVLGAPQQTLEGVDMAPIWGIEPTKPLAVDSSEALPAAGNASATEPAAGGTNAAPATPAPNVTRPERRGPHLLGVPVKPQTTPGQ